MTDVTNFTITTGCCIGGHDFATPVAWVDGITIGGTRRLVTTLACTRCGMITAIQHPTESAHGR